MFERIKNKINEDYVRQEASRTKPEDVADTLDNKEAIEHKMTTASLLKKYAELGKVMLNMLTDYRRGNYKSVPWFTIASMAFALLYILNPLDLVPDFIPGFGYVDDLSVLTLSMRFVETDLHKYIDWRLNEDQTE